MPLRKLHSERELGIADRHRRRHLLCRLEIAVGLALGNRILRTKLPARLRLSDPEWIPDPGSRPTRYGELTVRLPRQADSVMRNENRLSFLLIATYTEQVSFRWVPARIALRVGSFWYTVARRLSPSRSSTRNSFSRKH